MHNCRPVRLLVSAFLLANLFGSICCLANVQNLYICPGGIEIIPGAHQQFQLFEDGSSVAVMGVTWSSDPAAGTITANGLFTAGQTTGLYYDAVTATVPGGQEVTENIKVIPAKQVGGYTLERTWGNFAKGQFSNPGSVAIGHDGRIYVADLDNNRIQVFDSNGNYLFQWGSYGDGDQQFNNLRAIAVDSNGNILAADEYRGVFVFNSEGDRLGTFVQWDNTQILSLAVDSNGNVYIGAYGGIRKYDCAGVQYTDYHPQVGITSWYLATDSAGNLYASDAFDTATKCNSSGQRVATWLSGMPGISPYWYPEGIAVDSGGYVYVADGMARIVIFNPQGQYEGSFPVSGIDSMYGQPSALAIDSSDRLYICDTHDKTVYAYTTSGTRLFEIGPMPRRNGWLNNPESATDSHEILYVADTNNNHIQQFNGDGVFLTQWGEPGWRDGHLDYPRSLAVDSAGNVLVQQETLLQKFGPGGVFMWQYPTVEDCWGSSLDPPGVAVDSLDNVFSVNRCDESLDEVSSEGNLIGSSKDISCFSMAGITVDKAGAIYAALPWDYSLIKINSSLTTATTVSAPPYDWWQPRNVVMDASGNFYIVNWWDSSIIKLDSSARPIATWQAEDTDNDHPNSDIWVAVDADGGQVYIVNTKKSRIEKYMPIATDGKVKTKPDESPVYFFGGIVTAGSPELTGCFYIESPDRSWGIRVTGPSAWRGMKTAIDGVIRTVNGEREIQASNRIFLDTGSVRPLGVGVGMLGKGLDTTGLLVKIWGQIVDKDTSSSPRWFTIDDGSGSRAKCLLPLGVDFNTNWHWMAVTGISSVEESGTDLVRVIRVRDSGDIQAL